MPARRTVLRRGQNVMSDFVTAAWPRIAAVAIIWFAFPLAHAEIAGRPDILDGATIAIAGRPVVLFAIAAPPTDGRCVSAGTPWRCGTEASFALADIVGRTWVTCLERGVFRNGTPQATCYVGGVKGKDLGLAMISEGWALALPDAPDGYAPTEAMARREGRGL
jgi:endonuclease YncB( thermonuclease family)